MQSHRLFITADSQGPFRAPVNHSPALPAHEAAVLRDKPTAELHPVFSSSTLSSERCPVVTGPRWPLFTPGRSCLPRQLHSARTTRDTRRLQPTSTRLQQKSISLIQHLSKLLHLPTPQQKQKITRRKIKEELPFKLKRNFSLKKKCDFEANLSYTRGVSTPSRKQLSLIFITICVQIQD